MLMNAQNGSAPTSFEEPDWRPLTPYRPSAQSRFLDDADGLPRARAKGRHQSLPCSRSRQIKPLETPAFGCMPPLPSAPSATKPPTAPSCQQLHAPNLFGTGTMPVPQTRTVKRLIRSASAVSSRRAPSYWPPAVPAPPTSCCGGVVQLPTGFPHSSSCSSLLVARATSPSVRCLVLPPCHLQSMPPETVRAPSPRPTMRHMAPSRIMAVSGPHKSTQSYSPPLPQGLIVCSASSEATLGLVTDTSTTAPHVSEVSSLPLALHESAPPRLVSLRIAVPPPPAPQASAPPPPPVTTTRGLLRETHQTELHAPGVGHEDSLECPGGPFPTRIEVTPKARLCAKCSCAGCGSSKVPLAAWKSVLSSTSGKSISPGRRNNEQDKSFMSPNSSAHRSSTPSPGVRVSPELLRLRQLMEPGLVAVTADILEEVGSNGDFRCHSSGLSGLITPHIDDTSPPCASPPLTKLRSHGSTCSSVIQEVDTGSGDPATDHSSVDTPSESTSPWKPLATQIAALRARLENWAREGVSTAVVSPPLSPSFRQPSRERSSLQRPSGRCTSTVPLRSYLHAWGAFARTGQLYAQRRGVSTVPRHCFCTAESALNIEMSATYDEDLAGEVESLNGSVVLSVLSNDQRRVEIESLESLNGSVVLSTSSASLSSSLCSTPETMSSQDRRAYPRHRVTVAKIGGAQDAEPKACNAGVSVSRSRTSTLSRRLLHHERQVLALKEALCCQSVRDSEDRENNKVLVEPEICDCDGAILGGNVQCFDKSAAHIARLRQPLAQCGNKR